VKRKDPWGEGTPWKNSTAFFTYLRGCLRKAWSNNPIKHNLLKKKRRQIPNPNPKGKKPTVWGFDCSMCNNTFPMSECQVDHIEAAGSLNCTEDIQGFVERLLYVTEDDLRLVCKGCNSALVLSDKQGISFEEALIEKRIIAIVKSKQDKQWLINNGVVPGGNQAARRKQIKQRMEEINNGSEI
jgi:hypothetical protein